MSKKLPEISSVTTLGKLSGTSRAAIYRHIERAGLSPVEGKKYHTETVLKAITEHRKDDNNSPAYGRSKKIQLECELLQMKIDHERGLLVPVSEVVEKLDRIFTAIRQKFLAMPTKMAPLLIAKEDVMEIQVTLQDEVYSVLWESSAFVESGGWIEPDNKPKESLKENEHE